jgi:hypothetical protein
VQRVALHTRAVNCRRGQEPFLAKVVSHFFQQQHQRREVANGN